MQPAAAAAARRESVKGRQRERSQAVDRADLVATFEELADGDHWSLRTSPRVGAIRLPFSGSRRSHHQVVRVDRHEGAGG
eukprot:10843582-Heterocapsa_arctica.AAC.1